MSQGEHCKRAYANGVAKDEMSHHSISHKHHATDQAEMDEIRAGQGKGAGDNTQAGLEVHALQHPSNQQQDVNAVQGVVPCQLVHQVLQHRFAGTRSELCEKNQHQAAVQDMLPKACQGFMALPMLQVKRGSIAVGLHQGTIPQ